MPLLTTDVEWHDLRIDPDDLPGEGEPILATVETFSGDRNVWLDVFLQEGSCGDPVFCVKAPNEYGGIETTCLWYPVVAWAYPPAPYNFF